MKANKALTHLKDSNITNSTCQTQFCKKYKKQKVKTDVLMQ